MHVTLSKCHLDEICNMADLKFVFSNGLLPELKKGASTHSKPVSTPKKEELDNKQERLKENDNDLPLFHFHKIRAPKYEFF